MDKKSAIRRVLGLLFDCENGSNKLLRYVSDIPQVYTVSHIPEDSILLEEK
jgi:hypothetical protein